VPLYPAWNVGSLYARRHAFCLLLQSCLFFCRPRPSRRSCSYLHPYSYLLLPACRGCYLMPACCLYCIRHALSADCISCCVTLGSAVRTQYSLCIATSVHLAMQLDLDADRVRNTSAVAACLCATWFLQLLRFGFVLFMLYVNATTTRTYLPLYFRWHYACFNITDAGFSCAVCLFCNLLTLCHTSIMY
jgi:hypothetical protein